MCGETRGESSRAWAAANLQAFWTVALEKGHIRRLAGKQEQRRTGLLPVAAEFLQQPRRGRHQPLLVAFAVADVQLHPRAVDVGQLQVCGFGQETNNASRMKNQFAGPARELVA